MQLAPGGPIDQIADLNPHVTPEVKARIQKEMGLDQPIAAQYARWLKRMVFFNFGVSIKDSRPGPSKNHRAASRYPASEPSFYWTHVSTGHPDRFFAQSSRNPGSTG